MVSTYNDAYIEGCLLLEREIYVDGDVRAETNQRERTEVAGHAAAPNSHAARGARRALRRAAAAPQACANQKSSLNWSA
jgi:hypothetical protein